MVPSAHSKRTEVKEVSGQTGVPVLVDTEHGVGGMPESDDIVAYLEETYGSGASA
jgi:glutaredoxin 3